MKIHQELQDGMFRPKNRRTNTKISTVNKLHHHQNKNHQLHRKTIYRELTETNVCSAEVGHFFSNLRLFFSSKDVAWQIEQSKLRQSFQRTEVHKRFFVKVYCTLLQTNYLELTSLVFFAHVTNSFPTCLSNKQLAVCRCFIACFYLPRLTFQTAQSLLDCSQVTPRRCKSSKSCGARTAPRTSRWISGPVEWVRSSG